MTKIFNEVVHGDLNYINAKSFDELRSLAGRKVMIVGGAGFLGYYFCHAILNWNLSQSKPIRAFVIDNFKRGVPLG